MHEPGFFAFADQLKEILKISVPLRAGAALDRADRPKGGRPPCDSVAMFKILILGAMNNLSDDRI